MGFAKYAEDINETRIENLYYSINKIKSSTTVVKKPSTVKSETIIIHCEDCGRKFAFTVGEQEFYKKNGFADPKRCKECREYRRIVKLIMR